MYAIVECGGRQYRAEEGHTFSVEKLPREVGEQIVLDNVLLLSSDGEIVVGQPTVTGTSVLATVTDQYRGKKIFVWKYKPKKRYRRRRGHRQYYTRLRVDSIVVGDSDALAAARTKAAEQKAAAEAKAAEDQAAAEAAATAKAAEKQAAAEAAAAAKAVEDQAAAEAAEAAKAAKAQAAAEAAASAKVAEEQAAAEAAEAAKAAEAQAAAEAAAAAKAAEEQAAAEAAKAAEAQAAAEAAAAATPEIEPEPTIMTDLGAEDKTLILEAEADLIPSDDELGLADFMDSAAAVTETDDKTMIVEPDDDLIPDDLEMAGLVADNAADEGTIIAAPEGADFEGTIILEDLTLIEGIGPKTKEALQKVGILTFAELSTTSVDRIKEILSEAGLGGVPDTWPQQAGLAAKGDMEALTKLQDELDGGRRA